MTLVLIHPFVSGGVSAVLLYGDLLVPRLPFCPVSSFRVCRQNIGNSRKMDWNCLVFSYDYSGEQLIGAEGQSRTDTGSPPPAFESDAIGLI